MNVSVITPTYGGDIERASAVLAQLKPGDEWVIIDNNPEPTVKLDHSQVVVVHETDPGAYKARRAGIERASGEVFALLDAECLPDSGWLERGRHWFLNGSNTVAGRIVTKGEGRSLVEAYEEATAIPQVCLEAHRRLCAGNVWIRRETYRAIGGFDGNRRSGPDCSLVHRLKGVGGFVYDGGLSVSHPARTSWASIRAKYRRTAVSTRLQEKIRVLPTRLFRSFMPWVSLHKRIWARPIPMYRRFWFSMVFQSFNLYWMLHYIKGGEEPSR